MAAMRLGGKKLCVGWSNWGPFFRLEAFGKKIALGRDWGVISFSERYGYVRVYRFLGAELKISDNGI